MTSETITSIAALAADIIIKAGPLILLAVILNTLLAIRGNVLLRSAIWNATLIGLVVLPLATLIVPQFPIRCLPGCISSRIETETADIPTNASSLIDAPANTPSDYPTIVSPIISTPLCEGVANVSEPQISPTNTTATASLKAASLTGNRDRQETRSPLTWPVILVAAYAAGIAILLARLTNSLRLVRKLRNHSCQLADSPWDTSLTRGRTLLGIRQPVTLATSSRINVPIAFGWRRPMVLIPDELASTATAEQRDAILLHELAHIRRSDYVWQMLLRCVEAMYWPNPLVWLIARCMSTAREQACDELCTFHSGTPTAYRDTLLEVAAMLVRKPAVSLGIAMAKPSNIGRRLDRIIRGHRAPTCLARRSVRITVAAMLLATVGGLGSARLARSEPIKPATAQPAEQSATKPETQPAAIPTTEPVAKPTPKNALEMRVVHAQTKQPLPDVQLTVTIDKKTIANATTDQSGSALLTMPDPWPNEAAVLTGKDGFVPVRVAWTKETGPGVPHSHTLELEPGTTIGGIIKNEDGQPIEGVSIHLSVPDNGCGAQSCLNTGIKETVRSDANGRWYYDRLCATQNKPQIYLRHPDYVADDGHMSRTTPPIEKLRDQSCVMVMEKGVPITGRVIDSNGQPVAGATIVQSTFQTDESPRTQTGPDGRYSIPHAPPGPLALTAEAPGYAPDLRTPNIRNNMPAIDFKLSPARTIRAKVVYPDGKPVSNALVNIHSWRNIYGLQWHCRTDADGRFAWNQAPADAVTFMVYCKGYEDLYQQLIASPDEHLLQMKPLAADRTAEAKSNKPDAKTTSFKGTVLLPDGTPASGATVVGGYDKDSFVSIFEGQKPTGGKTTQSSSTGEFQLTGQGKLKLLIAYHDKGYAQIATKDLKKSSTIKLAQWGRIEGIIRIGSRIGINQTAEFTHELRSTTWLGSDWPNAIYTAHATTDDKGRFKMDRVPPGEVLVGRIMRTGPIYSTSTHGTLVEVKPGQTTNVLIGGSGRPVVGRLMAPAGLKEKVAWSNSGYASKIPPALSIFASREQRRKHAEQEKERPMLTAAAVDGDGYMRIEDVPAGQYSLQYTLHAPGVPKKQGPYVITYEGEAIATLEYKFTVPPIPGGQTDEPLDLGELTLKAK